MKASNEWSKLEDKVFIHTAGTAETPAHSLMEINTQALNPSRKTEHSPYKLSDFKFLKI